MSLKHRILDLASRQIRSGGWLELNFDTLAEQLGTTRSNIHYHFKTKEKLTLRVLKILNQENREQFRRVFEAHGRDFRKMVTHIEQQVADSWEIDGGAGLCASTPFLTNSSKIPATLRQAAVAHFEQEIAFWAELIHFSQRAGYVAAERDPQSLARQFVALFHGFRELGRTSPDPGHSPFRNVLTTWAATAL